MPPTVAAAPTRPRPSHGTTLREPTRTERRAAIAATLLILLALPALAAREAEPTIDPAELGALELRLVGPFRGGRSTAVAGVAGDLRTFYFGATGGGVWKTTDAGLTWKNVSDGSFGVGSIGAVAVAPSDPNVVWVGTGSACPRGNVSPGDGVYRSTDGGRSWSHLGLEDAGQIGRIRVHPKDPDTAWLAVLGNVFAPSATRGVYKTTDGGATWERVLFVSDEAGAVDLALDPANPRRLFAAIWPVDRKPWGLTSGSEEGGLWRSDDGGETWRELGEEAGLPEGVVGRIGVDVSPADPDRVWALIEHEEGGLFRSDDGGDTFRRVNPDRQLRQRAWYYTHVTADPGDADTVYVSSVDFLRSVDGGESFQEIDTPHGDHHALWIHPDDPKVMIQGNDGGATVTYNGGDSWTTQANQPTAEIYRLTVDDAFPYRLYGAQQDNSTVSIPSRTRGSGIDHDDWWSVGGGESGHIAVEPGEAGTVYAGSYGGTITRWNPETHRAELVMAWPEMAIGEAPRDLRYRFQWNAPIRLSPHDPGVLYHASNVVHRSTDRGLTWEVISPDLTYDDEARQEASGGPITRDNTGVEVWSTIFALEESPHQAGELWVGTDDGRVHIRRGDGAEWVEITPAAMPEDGQVNTIELSAHAPGRALMAVTRYKTGDFAPYVFLTDDYGASWRLLTDGDDGLPADHFVRVVREDPVREGLLYAGTEFGLYVSFDEGGRWQPLQLGLPVTPITDLAVHRGDLVVATQGRSFWILDDLSPLRQMDDEALAADLWLYHPSPAWRMDGRPGDVEDGVGQNPPAGAILYYRLGRELGEEDPQLKLEIVDSAGTVVRAFPEPDEDDPWAGAGPGDDEEDDDGGDALGTEAGLHRFVWDLRHDGPDLVDGAVLWGRPSGPRVAPGEYTVRLTLGDETRSETLEVRADPALDTSDAELAANVDLALAVGAGLERAHDALRTIHRLREQFDDLIHRAGLAGLSAEQRDRLAEAVDAAREQLGAIEEVLTQPRSEARQDPLNYPPGLDNQILFLLGVVARSDLAPLASSIERWTELAAGLEETLSRLDAVIGGRVATVRDLSDELAIPALAVPELSGVGDAEPARVPRPETTRTTASAGDLSDGEVSSAAGPGR